MNEANVRTYLKNLKYNIEITKRARIKASARLRNKNISYERVIHGYSILILILTIWFFGNANMDSESTKFLLILSLSVTFISMYLNMRNYKERAANFETNYQNLDILLHRIERKELENTVISIDDIKQFQREYEKLLIDKENHLSVDFMEGRKDYTKSHARKNKESKGMGGSDQADEANRSKEENKKKTTEEKKQAREIQVFRWGERIKYTCLLLFPLIIIITLLVFDRLINYF